MAHTSSDIMSPESFSNHLCGSLPVYVSPQDISKHPQLSHLLKDLSLRLTPTGTLKSTHARLAQSTVTLKHARMKYLEETTLQRVSQDVLLKMCDGDGKEDKKMKHMLEAVTLSELQDHLRLVRSSSEGQGDARSSKTHTLLSILPEDVLASCRALNPGQYIKDLSYAMEVWLEQEWIKIVSFLKPVGFEGCDSHETTKIVESFETTKQKLAEESSKLVHSVTQTDCLTQKVYSLLFDYSKILKSLVSKQRLSSYPAQHLANCLVSLRAHFLKLRCLELEVLTETYTSQSVRALKLLQSHLQERRVKNEESLVKLRHSMDAYKDLDPRFKDLLKEYAKLQEDINFAKISTGVSNL